jgi:hypothetical protein
VAFAARSHGSVLLDRKHGLDHLPESSQKPGFMTPIPQLQLMLQAARQIAKLIEGRFLAVRSSRSGSARARLPEIVGYAHRL